MLFIYKYSRIKIKIKYFELSKPRKDKLGLLRTVQSPRAAKHLEKNEVRI